MLYNIMLRSFPKCRGPLTVNVEHTDSRSLILCMRSPGRRIALIDSEIISLKGRLEEANGWMSFFEKKYGDVCEQKDEHISWTGQESAEVISERDESVNREQLGQLTIETMDETELSGSSSDSDDADLLKLENNLFDERPPLRDTSTRFALESEERKHMHEGGIRLLGEMGNLEQRNGSEIRLKWSSSKRRGEKATAVGKNGLYLSSNAVFLEQVGKTGKEEKCLTSSVEEEDEGLSLVDSVEGDISDFDGQ
ncbi:unnamed protein product [Toxocara canis]|uniref:PH domain-containing protein n=1 Tax=Toxocara canis TaxID=6265 RepID=A0A183VGK0_TOXCA|nr:unnamed protein product [Toxocara canis]